MMDLVLTIASERVEVILFFVCTVTNPYNYVNSFTRAKGEKNEWKGIRICHVITRSLLIVHDDGHYLSHEELIYLKILSFLII
jgi:hypothetical protein